MRLCREQRKRAGASIAEAQAAQAASAEPIHIHSEIVIDIAEAQAAQAASAGAALKMSKKERT